MINKFYITTTLPYVNAEPHIGFALEIVQADIIARYHKSLGDDVFFNTGTDEHGLKIYRKATEEGKEPQTYVDEYAEKFRNLKKALNLSDDLHFIRTTDAHHKKAAQEFWKLCERNGDIYKGAYKTKYCVGCELEKTDSELIDGKCPIHPNLEIEIIDEENYFFNFEKYREPLLKFYEKNPEFILPESRFNEIKKFVDAGLKNFSISRLKEKMPWGVPVPGDDKHVIYVWFDALVNYISTLGWPENEKNFRGFWGTKEKPNAIQLAGKDQIRQQAAMWQAMLMSAGLPSSKQILIHGFITSDGQKMSKSLGNVIDPYEIVEKYGTDALRYWLAREINPFEDGDFTWEKFKERYNADLANGLGNLVSRVTKMAAMVNYKYKYSHYTIKDWFNKDIFTKLFFSRFDKFGIQSAVDLIWSLIADADRRIQKIETFKKVKTAPDEAKRDLGGETEPWNEKEEAAYLLGRLHRISLLLEPILPSASAEILNVLKSGKEILKPLFPRK